MIAIWLERRAEDLRASEVKYRLGPGLSQQVRQLREDLLRIPCSPMVTPLINYLTACFSEYGSKGVEAALGELKS